MLLTLPISILCSLLPLVAAQSVASDSGKRGLVWIGNRHAGGDADVWHTNTTLNWYYNYARWPTPELNDTRLEYAPMYWGDPDEEDFRDAIETRKRSGEKITHVLGFNEPDMERDVGGSDMSASDAAALWQDQLEPLRDLGIKLGAPATSGSPIGYTWMKEFKEECGESCTFDFLPVHWYGPFEGMVGWIQNMSTEYPDLEIWVTEFGLPGASAEETEVFLRQSLEFLDSWRNVTRYAYFGSVRSGSSNIGSNAAMLNNDGEVTDVGRLYLGDDAIDSPAQGGASARAALSTPLIFAAIMSVLITITMC